MSKTDTNRNTLRATKLRYKSTIKKKKRHFINQRHRNIESLKHKSPKDVWKLFLKKKQIASDSIKLEEFYEYFWDLAEDVNLINENLSENFNDTHDFNSDDTVIDELDRRISVSEVLVAIKLLKQNKAPATDNILNEYFIEAGDIIAGHLADIFNGIFDSGKFPSAWTEGIIVPVYKRGEPTDVNNYRAITLVSCMAKLFTNILTKRLFDWADTYDTISDAQFGFRRKRSTIDVIFILQCFNNRRDFYFAMFS